MTEANTSFFTPQLVYLSANQDFKKAVEDILAESFGPTHQAYITWINEEQGTFSIEMVRELILNMSYAPLEGKVRHVVLVNIDQATPEAQNALLKLLEEPPAQTQIWLTAIHSQRILPTIISRAQETSLGQPLTELPQEISQLAATIPTLSHRELSDLAGNYSERADAQLLVNQLSHYFHTQLQKTAHGPAISSLKSLLLTSQYLDANVNVRLALEQCFFSLKKALS